MEVPSKRKASQCPRRDEERWVGVYQRRTNRKGKGKEKDKSGRKQRLHYRGTLARRALTRGGIARAPGEARSLGDKANEILTLLVRAEAPEVRDMGPRASGLRTMVASGHERHATTLRGLGAWASVTNRAKRKVFAPSSLGVKHQESRALSTLYALRIHSSSRGRALELRGGPIGVVSRTVGVGKGGLTGIE